jgi:hypothetical protein
MSMLFTGCVCIQNVGPHFETWNAGVLGPITLNGLNEGRRDLTWQKWSYKVGLKGEALSLHSLSGSSSVDWLQGYLVSRKQLLTWFKVSIIIMFVFCYIDPFFLYSTVQLIIILINVSTLYAITDYF